MVDSRRGERIADAEDYVRESKQRMNDWVVKLWDHAGLSPRGSFDRDGIRTRFHDVGSGKFVLPPPFLRRGQAEWDWEWHWQTNGTPAATGQWALEFGKGRRLVISPTGAALEMDGQRRVIANATDGVTKLMLRIHPQGIRIVSALRPDGIMIDEIGPDLPLNWKLGRAEVTAKLDLRPPKRGP